MNTELIIESIKVACGVGAFAFGLYGISRSLRLQKLLMRKQELGLDAQAVKQDPEVRAGMRTLRLPLILALVLAVSSVVLPPLLHSALG